MDGSNELIYTDTIHGCYKFTIDDLLDYFGNIFIAVQWEIIPLYGQVANSSSYTPIVSGSQDIYLYAMLQATTFNNPAGTWYGGMRITIKLKDNGTARALTWGTKYQGTFVALPSTTIANKAMFLEFMYYLYDDKFELLRVLNQP